MGPVMVEQEAVQIIMHPHFCASLTSCPCRPLHGGLAPHRARPGPKARHSIQHQPPAATSSWHPATLCPSHLGVSSSHSLTCSSSCSCSSHRLPPRLAARLARPGRSQPGLPRASQLLHRPRSRQGSPQNTPGQPCPAPACQLLSLRQAAAPPRPASLGPGAVPHSPLLLPSAASWGPG